MTTQRRTLRTLEMVVTAREADQLIAEEGKIALFVARQARAAALRTTNLDDVEDVIYLNKAIIHAALLIQAATKAGL
ncbi:hypothetical protein [uncultured Arsenicicoccus sp.]|uniref:hypothetical protein n=1 Tax=uncultured Arsenicicoccus sp. TaxID=491339 RepID=UPI002591D443|nr:hypothetical protein [uncultured Arsenicicoccus sp.]